jgi:hypothetical protein
MGLRPKVMKSGSRFSNYSLWKHWPSLCHLDRSGEICGRRLPLGNVSLTGDIPKEVRSRITSYLFKSDLSLAVRLYACEGLGC